MHYSTLWGLNSEYNTRLILREASLGAEIRPFIDLTLAVMYFNGHYIQHVETAFPVPAL